MSGTKRTAEVRLIVTVTVHLHHPELAHLLAAKGGKPSSIAEVVASEITANLESVPYVELVVVSPL